MSEMLLVEAIDRLAEAVKTQDNHVLADLDTYPVVTALNEIKEELQKTNLNLISIRKELQDLKKCNGG